MRFPVQRRASADREAHRFLSFRSSRAYHGVDPTCYTLSHDIAVGPPNSREMWWVDDEWGYLHVYDISVMPPKHLASVALFTDIQKPFTDTNARWVSR